MDKINTYIFVGRSGSGKGTQLKLLKEYLLSKNKDTSIKSIVMGDIFRAFFKESNFISNISRAVTMEEGKFQPNFLTDALFIRNTIDIVDEESILFFDGYPRNINQLETIEELLKYINRKEPIVINIEVSRENVRERMLSRGRGDDNEKAIESRLNEYDKFILPMLEVLKNDSYFKYIEVDGEGKIEDIHNNIIKSLNI
jgi:adenylate kinase